MNHKNFFLTAFLIALATPVFSLDAGMVVLSLSQDKVDAVFENGAIKPEILSELNSQAGQVPEQVFTLFGNKKINVYLELDNGNVKEYYAKTGAKTLEALEIGTRSDADLEVRAKEPTIDRIAFSQDPIVELTGAINSGEITYKGLSTEGQINSTIVNFGSGLFGFFDGIVKFFSNIFK